MLGSGAGLAPDADSSTSKEHTDKRARSSPHTAVGDDDPSALSPCRADADGDIVVGARAADGSEAGTAREEIVMCYHVGKGNAACAAYYVVSEAEICVASFTESADGDSIRRLLQDVAPTELVLSPQLHPDASRAAREAAAGQDGWAANVVTLRRAYFDRKTCDAHVLDLARQIDALAPPDRDRLIDRDLAARVRMSHAIDTTDDTLVKTLGALWGHLQANRVGVELEDAHVPVVLNSLRAFAIGPVCRLSPATYSALGIFQRGVHPSMVKASGDKELGSLFGTMNACKTKAGAQLLRSWFLRPSTDVAMLLDRQDAVEHLAPPEHAEDLRAVRINLSKVADVKRLLRKGRTTSRLKPSEWAKIGASCDALGQLHALAARRTDRACIFERLAAAFDPRVPKLGATVERVCEYAPTTDEQPWAVRPYVDDKLDRMKQTYNTLPDVLTEVAQDEMRDLQIPVDVIFKPLLGFLVKVANRYRGGGGSGGHASSSSDEAASRAGGRAASPSTVRTTDLDEAAEIPGLQFFFTSDGYSHYKSARTARLDATYGDIFSEIIDLESAILADVTTLLLQAGPALCRLASLCSELDCLQSLAFFARENEYCRPTLVDDERIISIVDGRHPLVELAVSPFVVNSTRFDEETRVQVVTGANASGKSVYLKQVALTVFLAQVGSFVPATEATVGIVDQIFTRIMSQESVTTPLSIFLLDLQQVTEAVRGATPDSLVILDEFGKGTAEADGIGILCAVCEEFVHRDETCPALIVSTHFHEITRRRLLPQSPFVTYKVMQTIVNDAGDMVYLFQVQDGAATSSSSRFTASASGLPAFMLERAEVVAEAFASGAPVPLYKTDASEARDRLHHDVVASFLAVDAGDHTGDPARIRTWLAATQAKIAAAKQQA